MRITNQVLYRTVLQNIQRPLDRMLKDQIELGTQRKINRHADDPIGSAQVRGLRSQLASIAQYHRNIDNAKSWMQATESSLNDLASILQRGRELAVEGANATRGDDDRDIIASEVNQLLESALGIANAEINDEFLFAGRDTGAAPFAVARDTSGEISGVTFTGDPTGAILREVDTGAYVAINVPGTDIFDLNEGPLETLRALRDALARNDPTAIQNTLQAFDNNLNDLQTSLGALGGTQARLEQLEARLELRTTDVTNAVSQLEDADLTTLLVQASADETAYRAALNAGSSILQTSILDYLR
jgi:flagellar hook-associated protein 3 FlgL